MSDNIESTILKEGRKEGRKEALSVSLLPVKNRRGYVSSSESVDMKRTRATLSSVPAVIPNGTSKVM